MKKLLLAFTVVACFTQSLISQTNTDPVLMTISGKDVHLSEFLNIYNKNNGTQTAETKTKEEYIDLFINFKLKVRASEDAGMDTAKKFKDELAGYRKQLAQPYLIDKQVNEKLVQEAYERYQWDVRASHIMIKLGKNPSPKDTLAAYNKILQIRRRILKGEDFTKVAKEVSEDPSVKDNGGDLGYFTAFYMVYPFETAAYETKVGQVSKPVRTKFGYHLVKVTDKRPARGELRCAHIMVKTPPDATEDQKMEAKNKIDEIYQMLTSGEKKFEDLAKEMSDDKASAARGGELPWFGVGRMVSEFEDAAFALKKDGDYSTPIMTNFGWHIVKRLEKRDFNDLEKIRPMLTNKVKRDNRAVASREALLHELKTEYGCKPDLKARNDFYTIVTDDYFGGEWSKEAAKGKNAVMFTLTDNKYSNSKRSFGQQDFALFLENQKKSQHTKSTIKVLVDNKFEEFVNKSVMSFEESILDSKYPEFKALMQEYHDGILLFDLMDKKVWSKAVQDTVGLEVYYEKHKTDFMWDERCDATIFTCANKEIAEKTRKLVGKQVKKNLSDAYIIEAINKGHDSEVVTIEQGKFLKGDNELVDKVSWSQGVSENMEKDGKIVFVVIHNKLQPEPKTLDEARGLVTAAYQSWLEQEWIKELRNKYKVEINKDVFSTIK